MWSRGSLIPLQGACTSPGKCMIVTELLPKGDLESMLRNKNVPLSTITQIKMARDAALGMNWYTLLYD